MISLFRWIFESGDTLETNLLLMILRVTLILALAWLTHAVLRRRNPRWRILTWRTAAVGVLLVSAVSPLPFRWTLPLLPASVATNEELRVADSADTSPLLEALQVNDGPEWESMPLPAQPEPAPFQAPAPETDALISAPVIAGPAAIAPSTAVQPKPSVLDDPLASHAVAADEVGLGWTLDGRLAMAWALGFAFISLNWLVGLFRLVSVYRHASTVPDDIAAEAKKAAETLGYRGVVDIRHTDKMETPCNMGAWRPRILIPTRQCELAERQELRATLAHELAHCKGNDLRWNHFLTLLSALLWFHPLAWRIRVAHAGACDAVCDSSAAGYVGDVELYGRLLAALALRVCGHNAPSALAMARRSHVRQRIESVLRNTPGKALTHSHVGGVVACAVAAMLLVGTVHISRSRAQTPSANKAAADATSEAAGNQGSKTSEETGKDPDREAHLPILVKSRESGEPLAGVEMWFNGRIGGDRFDARLTTDDNGFAELRRQASAEVQNLWMTAKKAGFVPVHYSWRSDVKSIELPKYLELTLPTGLQIKGRVEDESGEPIAGAKIELSMPITWPGLANHVFTAAELKTDADGQWSWDGAPEDTSSLSIRVTHSDFLRGGGRASRGSGNLVTLKSGLKVEGRVVDAKGKPIAGATAQLGLDRFGTGQPKATTDEEGYFEINKCKPGPSAVTVQAPGFSPAVKRIRIGEATEPVHFELELGHLLHGKIVDLQGNPIAGVLVAPDTWQGFRTLDNRMTTDETGRFSWDGAPPDGVEYSILKQGYMSRRDSVLKAAAEEQIVTLYPELQISGRVTDAISGKPLPEFAIRNGFLFPNSDRTAWSQDEAVPYTDGKYSYKFDEPMRGRLLQVIASGYEPKTSRVFTSHEGRVDFDFELQPGEGPSGIIVSPDGSPAVGADVGLATREKRAFLDGGRFDRSQNRAEVVKTDGNGRFRFLPQDDEPFILIAFHDTGFAEVTADQLASSKRILLEPWGKLRGRLLLGDQPDAGREVSYSPNRPRIGLRGTFISSYGYETKTGKEGRFEFDRVMPGPGTLSRVIITEILDSWTHRPCWQTPVVVQPHETTEAVVGGSGRPVVGKVALEREPDVDVDWTTNEPATIVRWDANKNRGADPYASYAGHMDASGEFRIPDVPAGDYKLTVAVNNPPRPNACGAGSEIGKAELAFSVLPMPDGRSDETLQLGTITARLFDTLDVGEAAPDFAAEDLSGGTLRLADYRGKLVLLDFWATWCGPCLAEMPAFKQIHERFKDNPRFALISLSCDNQAEVAREYTAAHSLAWNQAHVAGTQAKVPRDYTVRSLPATFLIAPDGTVLAKNLRGDDLETAVSAALDNDKLFAGQLDTRPARFPVVRFDADAVSATSPQPAVVVLDNIDPAFDKSAPPHDVLRALDSSGEELWCQSIPQTAAFGLPSVTIRMSQGARTVYGCDVRMVKCFAKSSWATTTSSSLNANPAQAMHYLAVTRRV